MPDSVDIPFVKEYEFEKQGSAKLKGESGMDSGVNYIVNNTGIPESMWGKYKPAGVNPDGPSVDF